MFGDNFLVAPIYKDELVNEINLPKGKWRYFFDDKEIVKGPVSFDREFSLNEFPVYIREGAIVPMDIKRSYNGIGDSNSEGYMTFLIYPDGNNEFTVYYPETKESTKIIVDESIDKIKIELKNRFKPYILNINLSAKPAEVVLGGKKLVYMREYQYNSNKRKLIIKTDNNFEEDYIIYKSVVK